MKEDMKENTKEGMKEGRKGRRKEGRGEGREEVMNAWIYTRDTIRQGRTGVEGEQCGMQGES
jgi:hypothetical protein